MLLPVSAILITKESLTVYNEAHFLVLASLLISTINILSQKYFKVETFGILIQIQYLYFLFDQIFQSRFSTYSIGLSFMDINLPLYKGTCTCASELFYISEKYNSVREYSVT